MSAVEMGKLVLFQPLDQWRSTVGDESDAIKKIGRLEAFDLVACSCHCREDEIGLPP